VENVNVGNVLQGELMDSTPPQRVIIHFTR
jgi:hypothetical protein